MHAQRQSQLQLVAAAGIYKHDVSTKSAPQTDLPSSQWQALPAANDGGSAPKERRDVGSTVEPRPSTATVIGWGDELLGL